MIYVKHIGIYVDDIETEEQFYKNVFEMKVICDAVQEQNEMLCALFHDGKGKALITKLITPLGTNTGMGEMVELIKIDGKNETKEQEKEIYETGTAHVCFGVDDIVDVVERVKENGGSQKTQIYRLGERYCVFCTDPEGNWIELIG